MDINPGVLYKDDVRENLYQKITAMPTSSSNEKLFWADRKNRMEKSRLDIQLKNIDREQMYLTHDIDREKRAVLKDLTLVCRSSGVSDQGVPPHDDKDTDYQSAPNYRMGLRLSERRLLEWRKNEKQVEKFMHQSAGELTKVSVKYRRRSSPEGNKLAKRAEGAKRCNRSTSSVGGYTEVKVLDDDVFTNGYGNPTALQPENVVNLNPQELEKYIFQQYKESINKTRIPSTSDVLKIKMTRHVRSDNNLGKEEKKCLRFRPHTASIPSYTKRTSLRGIPARPATALSKLYVNGKRTDLVKTNIESDKILDKPTKMLVNNFMPKPPAKREQFSEDISANIAMDVAEREHPDEMSECESERESSISSNPSPRSMSDRMRALMPEVEDRLKGTYINSSITIIYDDGDKTGNNTEGNGDNHGQQGTERLCGNTESNDGPFTSNLNHDETDSEEFVQTSNGIIKTDNGQADFDGELKIADQLSMPTDHGDIVGSRYSRPQRKVNRVLTGIVEDKVLTIEKKTRESSNMNRNHGDDILSATLSLSPRLTSRQRRPSTTSSLSQSDRLSGIYSSISDIYSIVSDGQRRPSKWRQYVAADTAPVPQKKMVTVTAVVKAALAFSKMARKRALNKLVEEQSTDPVELIRHERLRRLHSRNNILQTISKSWSINGENNISEVQE